MKDFIGKDIEFYYPLLALEMLFPKPFRAVCRKFASGILLGSAVCALFAGLLMAGAKFGGAVGLLSDISPFLPGALGRLFGIALLALCGWLALTALEALYYSISSRGDANPEIMTLEAVQVFFASQKFDITEGLLCSPPGRKLCARLGLRDSSVREFLAQKSLPATQTQLVRPASNGIRNFTATASLAITDKSLLDYMFSCGIAKEMFVSAAMFVDRTERKARLGERWWDIQNLKRIKGFGEEWSYGGAWFLRRYTSQFTSSSVYRPEAEIGGYGSLETKALENVLARSYETNALLISDDGISIGMVLSLLWKKISSGDAPDEIAHKQMLVLNGAHLLAASGQSDFEKTFLRLMDDSVKAGNIILIFEELPQFSQSARKLGVNFDTLIDPYLSSNKVQIIATSAPEAFHREFGESGELAERFEQVFIKPPGIDSIVSLLESTVVAVEKKSRAFFTYQALRALADSARDYSGFGSLLDHALDLLDEVVVVASHRKNRVISADDIGAIMQNKTGIPSANMSSRERGELLQLEAILSKKVIGQHAAVSAVAGAVRRARSGLASHERPMSSFLFLGPTGVGKTETAKALAEVFFEGEDKIIRLDMSEYNGADALERLIGSSVSGQPGALSQALRERPYGVLLLDEFEKAHRNAHDLFLQILDEGFFTDMRGKRVSARNLIIIATSNAGSDYIWQLVEQSRDPSTAAPEITWRLIEQGLFRPELLNRFDGVVIFRPLSKQDLASVAKIMLQELGDNLGRKGYKLEISLELVEFLVKAGYDPAFGARPMRRAITDNIEQLIARKIISGDIKPGDKIAFSREELKAME
jgi:ATP-dependent Clp protease ATP-binding subunit ClpC